MSSEISRANSSEASLGSALNSESLRAASAEESLDTKVSVETSRAISAELSLSYLLGADVSSEISRAISAEASLDSALSAEISRATSIEGTLDGKISDIISNVDINAIDSFTEVIENINVVMSGNSEEIYSKKNTSNQTPDGVSTVFEFVHSVKLDSEQVYLNGLLQVAGVDYSANISGNRITGIEFGTAPATTDSVIFYGVWGAFSTIGTNV